MAVGVLRADVAGVVAASINDRRGANLGTNWVPSLPVDRWNSAEIAWLCGIEMRSRVQRPNLDSLLDDLMEPVARQARRRAANTIREAA